MNEYVPHFAVFIFALFGIAIFSAMQRLKKMNEEESANSNKKPKV